MNFPFINSLFFLGWSCTRPARVLCLLVLLLTGCVSLPSQEMSDARRAIQVAHDAGAQRSASRTFEHAEQAISAAGKALSQGEYKEAALHAQLAKERADSAYRLAVIIHDARKAMEQPSLTPQAMALFERALLAAQNGDERLTITLINSMKNALQDHTKER